MWHPTLIAEALFAIANIFSSLRLISLFTANSHLGPLQISLGRMLLDILKFLFIYCLVRVFFYPLVLANPSRIVHAEHTLTMASSMFANYAIDNAAMAASFIVGQRTLQGYFITFRAH